MKIVHPHESEILTVYAWFVGVLSSAFIAPSLMQV